MQHKSLKSAELWLISGRAPVWMAPAAAAAYVNNDTIF
jgi:hypothetical protein